MSALSSGGALLLAACVSLVGLAGPAAAHAGLIESSPADGASVQPAPRQVSLRFTEPLDPKLIALVVTGPDGPESNAGPPFVSGAEVVQPLPPASGDGMYRVAYRVVSTDGHPVQGQVGFRVIAPARVPAVPGPADSPSAAADPSPPADPSPAGDPSPAAAAAAAPAPSAEPGGLRAPLLGGAAAVIAGVALLVVGVTRRTRGTRRV